jgi:hypothetical protein
MIPHHVSSQKGTRSNEWGTPDHILQIVRDLYGPFTHDLASSAEANRTVQALNYYDLGHPCPMDPKLPVGSTVWCNPPGPVKSVKAFWEIWCTQIVRGAVGGFLIFDQDHWRQLPAPPTNVTAAILRKRLKFVCAGQGAPFASTLIVSGTNLFGRRWEFNNLGHIVLWGPQ